MITLNVANIMKCEANSVIWFSCVYPTVCVLILIEYIKLDYCYVN